VAALTEAPEVTKPVVGRIMVQMRRGQDHTRRPRGHHLLEIRPAGISAPGASPGPALGVIPAAIGKRAHRHSVWAAAGLADASCALKTHPAAQVLPEESIHA
jgi:hypothetical protein